jgi:hypothetical protein
MKDAGSVHGTTDVRGTYIQGKIGCGDSHSVSKNIDGCNLLMRIALTSRKSVEGPTPKQ